jgi:hypothetical protein
MISCTFFCSLVRVDCRFGYQTNMREAGAHTGSTVPVHRPFLTMLVCGVGARRSWLLSRGALMSPLDQSLILHRCKLFGRCRSGKCSGRCGGQ